MGNRTKEDELYREMCRVVGKVVLEMRDLGQEPKHIVIAGVLRTQCPLVSAPGFPADAPAPEITHVRVPASAVHPLSPVLAV